MQMTVDSDQWQACCMVHHGTEQGRAQLLQLNPPALE